MGGRFEIFARLYKNFAERLNGNWNIGKFLFSVTVTKKIAAVNRLRRLDGYWYSRHSFIWRAVFRRINQPCKNYLCLNDSWRDYGTASFKLKKNRNPAVKDDRRIAAPSERDANVSAASLSLLLSFCNEKERRFLKKFFQLFSNLLNHKKSSVRLCIQIARRVQNSTFTNHNLLAVMQNFGVGKNARTNFNRVHKFQRH